MQKQAGNIILIQELQKYAESEEVPKYTLKQKRPSKLDPYKDRSTGDFLKTIEFTKMENTKNCIAFL